jgi:hypothetical protein
VVISAHMCHSFCSILLPLNVLARLVMHLLMLSLQLERLAKRGKVCTEAYSTESCSICCNAVIRGPVCAHGGFSCIVLLSSGVTAAVDASGFRTLDPSPVI